MWASASAALLTAWRQCLPFFCLPFYCLSIVFLFLIFYLFSFGCAGSSSLNRLFSSRGEQGRPLVAVCRLLLLEASFVVELRLKGVWASVVQECDPWAWWFRSVTHGLGGSGAWLMGLVVQECDPWAQSSLVCSTACGNFSNQRWNVSYTGRHILYHWATREAQQFSFKSTFLQCN